MIKARHNIKYDHTLRGAVLLSLIITFSLTMQGVAIAKKVQEYHIKAVFLYNLTYFVYWPPQQKENSLPFTIAIYGPDPFGPLLDQTVAKELKFEQPIKMKRIASIQELDDHINILFISSEAMDEWPEIVRFIKGRPILTVSDNDNFTRTGGMVALLKQDQKIQVEINHNQVRQSGLSMSAKLLRLARIVGQDNDTPLF